MSFPFFTLRYIGGEQTWGGMPSEEVFNGNRMSFFFLGRTGPDMNERGGLNCLLHFCIPRPARWRCLAWPTFASAYLPIVAGEMRGVHVRVSQGLAGVGGEGPLHNGTIYDACKNEARQLGGKRKEGEVESELRPAFPVSVLAAFNNRLRMLFYPPCIKNDPTKMHSFVL